MNGWTIVGLVLAGVWAVSVVLTSARLRDRFACSVYYPAGPIMRRLHGTRAWPLMERIAYRVDPVEGP